MTVKVVDVNDNPPVFPPSCCHVNISEGVQLNKLAFKFEATDPDIGSNSVITYKLLNERGKPWTRFGPLPANLDSSEEQKE